MQSPSSFIRNATGLVRGISFVDALFMNLGFSGPVGYAVAYTIAWVPAAFPGANLIVSVLVAMLLSFFVVGTYGLFSAAMPRSGGDYVFVSRVLKPSLGFLVNWVIWFWTMIWFATATNWLTTFAIVPALANIGFVSRNQGLINLSSGLSAPIWVFLIGVVVIVILGVLSIRGVRALMSAQKYFVLAALIGSIISIGVLLTHTHNSFVSAFNQYMNPYTGSSNSFSWLISQAQKLGYNAVGYNIRDTLLALPFGYFAFGWAFASAYVGGEFKHANNVKRQLVTTIGASAVVGLLTATLIGLLLNVVGYNFFSSASYIFLNSPQTLNVPVPSYGMFNLFVSFLSGNVYLAGLINILFIGWGLLALPVLFMTQSRCLFAWSFDRIIPSAFAQVSERYNTPVNSIILITALGITILGFYTFLPFFFSLFTTTILQQIIFALIPVGIAGAVFPFRKKVLYSNAKISFMGIPLITIFGIAMVIFLGYVAAVMLGTTQYGTSIANVSIPFTIGLAFSIGGLVIFYSSKLINKSKGINIDEIFKEIPPE